MNSHISINNNINNIGNKENRIPTTFVPKIISNKKIENNMDSKENSQSSFA